jgi:hypothetical protein
MTRQSSSDERAFIHAVLEHVGGDAPRLLSHYVHPDRLSPLTEWDSDAESDDEPLWNPQMALHWSLYEALDTTECAHCSMAMAAMMSFPMAYRY